MTSTLFKEEETKKYSQHIKDTDTPIWNYWGEFIEKYLRTGRSQVTVKGVKDALRFAARRLYIYTIEDLNNPRHLEDTLFEYKSRQNISPSTYNSYLKNFNTYFIWLEKMEYIKENRIKKVMRCSQSQNEQITLDENKIKQVIAQLHDRNQTRLERTRNIFFIDLLRFTGARPCELLGLKLENITLDGITYKLVIKGRKQKGRLRYYNLPSFLRDSYESYLICRQKMNRNEENLFVSCSRRTGWTYDGMKRLFHKLTKELGFKVTAYAFRRFVATKLYNEEISIEKIANYLGHTKTITTKRYIERSCALTEDCGEIMGKV